MAGSLHQIILYTKGEDHLFTVVNSILASKNDLQFCVRVLARIIGSVDQGNRAKIIVLVFEGKSGIKELIVDLFTVEVTTGKNAGPGFERLKASPYQQLKINYGNSL